MPQLVVATFNIHAGTDGWGTPFDVMASCDELGADILSLQETWTPDSGRGSPLRSRLARLPVARLRSRTPSSSSRSRARQALGPRNPRRDRSLWVGDAENLADLPGVHWDQARRGTWGLPSCRGCRQGRRSRGTRPAAPRSSTAARGHPCEIESTAARSPSSACTWRTSPTDRRSWWNACAAGSRPRGDRAYWRVT